MVILYVIKDYTIFVGVDQFENEDLIKYSAKYMENLDEKLIWFHADKFSSPHAYIKMHPGDTEIPKNLIDICCQICKDGSIKGCKEPAIDVVYCEAINLSKAHCNNPGQVTFKDQSACKFVKGVKKNNMIINMLAKIKGECALSEMNKDLDDLIVNRRNQKKAEIKAQKEAEEKAVRDKKQAKMDMLEGMTQADGIMDEDDFM